MAAFNCNTEPIEVKETFKILDSQIKPQLIGEPESPYECPKRISYLIGPMGPISCLKFILWEAELQHS